MCVDEKERDCGLMELTMQMAHFKIFTLSKKCAYDAGLKSQNTATFVITAF